MNYKDLESKIENFLPNSSKAFKLVLAVAISANYKNKALLWLLLVGPPSSGKTDLVRLLKEYSNTYYLDNLTQNSFISGERPTEKEKVYDLLPLLNDKCWIIKDWTSIFSLDEKMTKKLLGDLVNIYDHEFVKFSSRRGPVSYESQFSHLGCITPATLNKHTQYMNMVGPRFLLYTLPEISPEEEENSFKKIFAGEDRMFIEKELRRDVTTYLEILRQKDITSIKGLDSRAQNYIKIASKLMANCRGIIIIQSSNFKDNKNNDITYYEVSDIQIEQPWRAVIQLNELAKYLAFVAQKQEVGVEELEIIKEVVLSSMPADRANALKDVKVKGGKVTAKQLTDLSGKSVRTSRRLLEELSALGILEKSSGGGTIANDYKLTEQFSEFILLDTKDFLSGNLSGTKNRDSSLNLEQMVVDEFFK